MGWESQEPEGPRKTAAASLWEGGQGSMRDAASLAWESEPATTLTLLGYIVRGGQVLRLERGGGGGLLGLFAT